MTSFPSSNHVSLENVAEMEWGKRFLLHYTHSWKVGTTWIDSKFVRETLLTVWKTTFSLRVVWQANGFPRTQGVCSKQIREGNELDPQTVLVFCRQRLRFFVRLMILLLWCFYDDVKSNCATAFNIQFTCMQPPPPPYWIRKSWISYGARWERQ